MSDETPNFTFAGCGFLGIYHVGVASCLREYAPEHMIKHKIGGASAGAMVAALLLCEAPLGYCTSWTLNLAAKARQRSLGPMHPSFNITEHLRGGLEEILPENAHEMCHNKLHVSMTRVRDCKNVIITEFYSRNELIQALLCSAFIPLWSGMMPPKFRGERYVDGALSDNLPKINSHTITVSPFAGRSDICPQNESVNIHHMFLSNTSIQFSTKNLYRMSRIMFPPHPEKLSAMCKRGFEDALTYLKNNKLVNCSRHLAIRSVLSRARTVSTLYEDEEDEEYCDEPDSCEHCSANQSRDRNLHPSVISALEEAIALVNSNYLLYIKNNQTYRTFSVICSPLYLPFDVLVAVLSRILKWLPSLRSDVSWLMTAALFYTKLLSGKVITKGKHTYTAKLVCQLAITEVQQLDITSDMVMTTRAHIRDQRIGFGLGMSTAENIEFVHNMREQYLESKEFDSLEVDAVSPSGEHRHQSFSRHGQKGSHSCRASRANTPVPSRRPSLAEGPQLPLHSECDQYLDTFEQCMQVADHREALLAYYYKDEAGQLKTTEIFKLEEPEPEPLPTELVSALAAKKLKQYGSTRSIISAVNIENEIEAAVSADDGNAHATFCHGAPVISVDDPHEAHSPGG